MNLNLLSKEGHLIVSVNYSFCTKGYFACLMANTNRDVACRETCFGKKDGMYDNSQS